MILDGFSNLNGFLILCPDTESSAWLEESRQCWWRGGRTLGGG